MTPELQFHWHPAIVSIDRLFYRSPNFVTNFFLGIAAVWLFYRAWLVLSKPIDELIGLLGLDVPVAPTLSLAGVKADGILLHWKAPEAKHTVQKYIIKINGMEVGEASPNDNSVTVTSLQPETFYVVRVLTASTANFLAASPPIHVKTLPASSGEFWNTADHKVDHIYTEENGYQPAPTVRTYKGFSDNFGPPIIAPPMTREHSNSQSRSKRADTIGRRNTLASDYTPPYVDTSEGEESIQKLTEKLDAIRRETEEAEEQIIEEEQEFFALRDSLLKEKEDTRQALKDREDTTKGIKKEVSRLERQNAAAQNHKSSLEKQLQSKKAEREKMAQDQEKWKRQIEDWKVERARIIQAIEDVQKDHADRIERMQLQLADEQKSIKQLEEDIRLKGTTIKDLEEERKVSEQAEGPQGAEQIDPEALENDRAWERDFHEMQTRYTQAWNAKETELHLYQTTRARLEMLPSRRGSQPQLYTSFSPPEGPPTRRNSQHRRRRTPSMRNEQPPVLLGPSLMSSAPPFNNSISSISPTFSSPSPYFNIANGTMNGALPPSHAPGLTPSEAEGLTGGAPMSPTAGALLPAGLLGDDIERSITNGLDSQLRSSPDSSTRLPLLPGLGLPAFPGLGAPVASEQAASPAQDPSSPVSVQSRSPSLFASPRESATQLGSFNPVQDLADSDRRSIRSASSSLRSTTRFGSLFGFNRQRGKTTSEDGPALGSLKTSQTQSLPRQEELEQDPIGSHRRRGSHSGSWMNQLSSPFTRGLGGKTATEPTNQSPKHVATRRRPFNMFGSKGDPWLTSVLGADRPSSPRPGSTKSIEATALPRPSTESQQRFGWPVEGFGTRNSPLGADWGLSAPNSWSRHPSRRPSIQYGSSSNLVHDSTVFDDDEDEEDLVDLPESSKSPVLQAPIGTRPTSSSQAHSSSIPPTPPKQLNPAAPHFKSLFSRDKKGDKADKTADKKNEKVEKASRKQKEKENIKPDAPVSSPADIAPASPPDPRKSRDTPSIAYTTTDSNASPRNSLDRTNSHTPSEVQTTPSLGKESFMSKLSRKSSSGKFNFPSFSKSKKQPSEVGTPDEIDEDATAGNSSWLGRGMTDSSANASPSIGSGSVAPGSGKSSGLSWSSIKRMGKKGEKAPSLHESVTSETGDEDDGLPALGLGLAMTSMPASETSKD